MQAFLWDVDLLVANVEAYNEPSSEIVVHARRLHDVVHQDVRSRRADTGAYAPSARGFARSRSMRSLTGMVGAARRPPPPAAVHGSDVAPPADAPDHMGDSGQRTVGEDGEVATLAVPQRGASPTAAAAMEDEPDEVVSVDSPPGPAPALAQVTSATPEPAAPSRPRRPPKQQLQPIESASSAPARRPTAPSAAHGAAPGPAAEPPGSRTRSSRVAESAPPTAASAAPTAPTARDDPPESALRVTRRRRAEDVSSPSEPTLKRRRT